MPPQSCLTNESILLTHMRAVRHRDQMVRNFIVVCVYGPVIFRIYCCLAFTYWIYMLGAISTYNTDCLWSYL